MSPKAQLKNKPSDIVRKESLEKTMGEFKVIEKPNLQRLFQGSIYATTVATTFFIFLGLYSHGDMDVLYVSGGLASIVSLLIANELFRQFPKMLLVLWQRDLFKQSKQNGITIAEFLQETKKYLDSKMNYLFGVAGFGLVGWIVWLLDNNWVTETADYLKVIPIPLMIALISRGVFLFSGFIGGMVGWRIFVIARRISVLGTQFELDLKINHHDGCGGLRPIGDLCQLLAYCLVPFLILIGAWLTFVNTLDMNYLRMLPESLGSLISTLQVLIAPLVASGFLVFFLPLISIHNSMERFKLNTQKRLDDIDRLTHLLENELLNRATDIAPKDGNILEERTEFLKGVRRRFDPIPIWPFRSGHLLRLTSSQIIPIIGLISSLTAFFRDLIK